MTMNAQLSQASVSFYHAMDRVTDTGRIRRVRFQLISRRIQTVCILNNA